LALESALREYERCHAIWMETVVGSEAMPRAKADKDEARERYLAAYQAMNPTHIVIGG
jgi:hypothetical protein